MEDEFNNSEGITGEGQDDNKQKPNENGSDVGNLKDILGEALKRDFKTDEDALKSVKDTFDFVGKAGSLNKVLEEIREVKGLQTDEEAISFIRESSKSNKDDYVSKEELAERDFFFENPDYKPYKSIIKAMKSDKGIPLEDVVKSEDFKTIFDKVQAHDKSESSKSVIHSNPRLSSVRDKMSEAREHYGKGNLDMAGKSAVEAVLDTYERE